MKNQTIPAPVKGGIAKVPVVMQMQMLECGAASLCMVLAYYHKWVPLEKAALDCGVSRDGSTAKNIASAARNYGLEVHALKMEPSDFKEYGEYPCIIHWNYAHFVVLDGFRGNTAIINDPASGRRTVSMEEFDDSFTGVCLLMKPTKNFVADGQPKNIMKYTFRRLKDAHEALAFVVLTTLAISLLSMMEPAFTNVFYDRLLTGENPDWYLPFMIGLGVLVLLRLLMSWIQARYKTRLEWKMHAVGSASYMWHILHLPMTFFSQRLAGDLIGRKNTNGTIEGTLLDTIAPLGLNLIMMIFYLIIMLNKSLLLTGIGILAMVLSLLVSRFISAQRYKLMRVQARDTGNSESTVLAAIEAIETIKASGAEIGFFQKWAGLQASINAQNVRSIRLNNYLGNIPALFSELADVMVLLIGIRLILAGEIGVGGLMSFQSLLSLFTSPAMQLIDADQTLQDMRTMVERVEDVMNYPTDPLLNDKPTQDEASYQKLSGELEMRDVCFGYNPLDKPLIQDFNIHLKPGSRVAFVGSSGCGKSTLANLITGLYQPRSGQILFDGKPMSEIDRTVFTASVAMVEQEIVLFEDSIANNLRMWDSSIEDYEIIMSAQDAQIHKTILQREGGYDYSLSEGGKDFSGGQKQCLEIARVLAQDPTLLILDEATSALDARTEFEVMKAIKAREITCVVIAHRLSTIRDCDEIIVLDHGLVVERGTHDELMALNGAYAALVTSD